MRLAIMVASSVLPEPGIPLMAINRRVSLGVDWNLSGESWLVFCGDDGVLIAEHCCPPSSGEKIDDLLQILSTSRLTWSSIIGVCIIYRGK